MSCAEQGNGSQDLSPTVDWHGYNEGAVAEVSEVSEASQATCNIVAQNVHCNSLRHYFLHSLL